MKPTRALKFTLFSLVLSAVWSTESQGSTVGCIDGAQYSASDGLISIAGWACNPGQTHIELWTKEAHDNDWILYKRFKASDYARPDLVSGGWCASGTDLYGYSYTKMRLSPGSYTFKIKVQPYSDGPYSETGMSCSTWTTPVTVPVAFRTAAISNSVLAVRIDKQRGGLIDNVVFNGANWLVNDQDGRGIGNSGILFPFNGVNTLVNEGGTASGSDNPNDGDDQRAGDIGNSYVTTNSYAGKWAWSKAHTLNFNVLDFPQWTYRDMTGTTGSGGNQIPFAPPESTAITGTIASGGTAIRLDHLVSFTPQNQHVIRIKERVRNQTNAVIDDMAYGFPGWPLTQQTAFNRSRFTYPQRWYIKTGSPATWTQMPDLSDRWWYGAYLNFPDDYKVAGTSGVVVGGPGGAVGMKCEGIGGYYVGDFSWTNIVGILPGWSSSSPFPNLSSGGSATSTCYYAFGASSTAVSDVGQWLDSAAGYSYYDSPSW